MASIGGVACNYVRGHLPAPRQRSEVWETPGLNGYGIQLLGLGDSEMQFQAIYLGSVAACDAWAAAVQALQGSVVNITTDRGQSYNYCFLQRVGNAKIEPAYIPGTTTRNRAEIEIVAIIL